MTAPHTGPSEEQVRAWLEQWHRDLDRDAFATTRALVGSALALLDAGRQDRERVDWLELDPCTATHNALRAWEDPELSFRAAIDRARGA